MDIFFNELSLLPECTHITGKERIKVLLETMKALKKYDFNILRTHDNFYLEDLGSGYTATSFINDQTISPTMKLLLRTIVKNPYADDNSIEADMFAVSDVKTNNHLDILVSPQGLAMAFLNNLPTVSLTGNSYWESPHLTVNDVLQANSANIINFHTTDILGNLFFVEWLKKLAEIDLNSAENIYKVFLENEYYFDSQAIKDIISWYYDDKRYLIRIKELLEDIKVNPFVGGKGKTETLAGTSGKASKRIVKKDRIIYTKTQDKIIVHQCRGHYDDK